MVILMTPRFWMLEPQSDRLLLDSPKRDVEQVLCPLDEGHTGIRKRSFDMRVVADPRKLRDVTWTWSNDILLSHRVLDIFEKNHVTGFETHPVEVEYTRPIQGHPPDMFQLIVTGCAGHAAAAAGVELVKSCPECGSKGYTIAEPSLLIDPGRWDGSDLFFAWPLPRYRFASDRLATILRDEKVSGLRLIPAADIPAEKGARVNPGALTSHVPAGHAKELAERFGIIS